VSLWFQKGRGKKKRKEKMQFLLREPKITVVEPRGPRGYSAYRLIIYVRITELIPIALPRKFSSAFYLYLLFLILKI
jgi:hypothetical protein